MTTLALFFVALFLWSLVARRLEASMLTAPMVFAAAGLLIGPGVVGMELAGTDLEDVRTVGELTLALLLFVDAARITRRSLRTGPSYAPRLLGLGMPLTIALGFLAALVLLPELRPIEAGILATVLAPTDAALGQAVVSNPGVPAAVRKGLNVESGLNDGLSVPFLTLLLAIEGMHLEGRTGLFFLAVAAQQIGLGALAGTMVGAGGGWLLRRARDRSWLGPSAAGMGALALALLCYFAATALGGNGFIAAFVGGFATRWTGKDVVEHAIEFAEEEGQVLNFLVFFWLGAAAWSGLGSLGWRPIAYAVASLSVVRMLPVALAFLGSSATLRTRLFLGWFGPRGLASIVLGLIVVEEAPMLGDQGQLGMAVATTVLLSVLLHGATAAPLARAFGRAEGLKQDISG